MAAGRDDGEGSATRRRERHLRSWLKHERQSVAMALSEFQHHSSRGQRKDSAGEEGHRDKVRGATATEAPFLPGFPAGRRHGSSNAPWISLPLFVPVVEVLDIPAPQMVEQLLEVFGRLDIEVPEQVIEVPKSSQDCIRGRLVDCDLRRPQMAEQLIEVPTVLSLAEQIVDNPASCGRGLRGGIEDFSQDRVQQLLPTLTFQFLVAIFKVSSRARVQLPHLLTLLLLRMRLVKGVFALFLVGKMRQYLRTRGRNCLHTGAHGRRQLMPCRRSWRRRSGGGGCRRRLLRRWTKLFSYSSRRRRGGRGRRGKRGFLVPVHIPRVAALVVDSGSGMLAMLVFLVIPWSSLFFGPSCFPCCTRTRCSCPCPAGLAGFTGCTSSSWTSCRALWWRFRSSSWTRLWCFYRCCGLDSAYRLEVPQVQLFNKVVFTPVVAQSLSPMIWQTIEILLLYI